MSSLMFISFDDLITDFAKDHDIHEWEILVASHEIMGSLTMRSAIHGVSTGINYESKYDNIEFVNSLRPTPNTMEYAYGSDRATFIEMYNSHLISYEPYMDLCSIVDMVVNSDCNVMIVMASYECSSGIDSYLRDFIEDEFGLIGYMYTDMRRLNTHYGTEMYDKIVASLSYEVPETFTGRNFEVIIQNCMVDEKEVKENLEAQKVIAASMSATPGEENDLTSIFFNKFTEDLETKMREVLMEKNELMIKELCRQKKIRISPGSSKEYLVDKLMHNIRKDAAREVEYVEQR